MSLSLEYYVATLMLDHPLTVVGMSGTSSKRFALTHFSLHCTEGCTRAEFAVRIPSYIRYRIYVRGPGNGSGTWSHPSGTPNPAQFNHTRTFNHARHPPAHVCPLLMSWYPYLLPLLAFYVVRKALAFRENSRVSIPTPDMHRGLV